MINNKILTNLRKNINCIDTNIIKLLSERKKISIKIVKEKIKNNFSVRDKDRENKLFQKIKKTSKIYNLDYIYIKKIFKIIVNNSVNIQKENYTEKTCQYFKSNQYICAYLGPLGSYSSFAFNILNKEIKKPILLKKECTTFLEIANFLQTANNHLGLLPIENNTTGKINDTYEILIKENCYITQELYIKINHSLLSVSACQFNEIKFIYSHVQPFKQCSQFLKNFPDWKKKNTLSTSAAMKKIYLENKKTAAVIGNEIGGKLYHLKTIVRNISNNKNNTTRFIIISKLKTKVEKHLSYKITIQIEFFNDKKDLNKILIILQENNILVKKVNTYKYNEKTFFFIDIISNIHNQNFQELYRNIKNIVLFIKILGCYPNNEKLFHIK